MHEAETDTFTLDYSNIMNMVVSILISLCDLGIDMLRNNMLEEKTN